MQKAAEQNLSEQDTSEFVLNMMLAMTTAEMMTQVYTKRAYDNLSKVLQNSGQLVKTEAQAMKFPGYEQIHKIPGLGVLSSDIQGLYARKELANAFKKYTWTVR